MDKVIDFHAHAFPEKVAAKAAAALGRFYTFPVEHTATAEALQASAKRHHITKIVVHSTATVPHQVEHINDFVLGLQSDLFIPFGSMHADYPHIEREIERIYAMGLKGLKLHPDYQEFDANAKKAIPIYKAIERLGMPLLIHGGDPKREYSRPHKIADIKQHCPDLTIIVAHMGGFNCLEEANKYIIGQDFYIDTSSSLWYIEPDVAVDMIRRHGADRVLFGTDYPVSDHDAELMRIRDLNLTDSERENILYNNAAKLLKL